MPSSCWQPPSHTKSYRRFHKMPAFDFRRIPLQTIIRQLEMICQGGLKGREAVLERVARWLGEPSRR